MYIYIQYHKWIVKQYVSRLSPQYHKHIVLLFTCGTVVIELWRECLLKDACDRLYTRFSVIMEFNWRVGHLFGGLRNRLVLNTHVLRISVVHLLVYIYIYKQIQVIHRWIQNSTLQLRSGLTVNRLLNMSTYGFWYRCDIFLRLSWQRRYSKNTNL